jgi:Carboxypeptidase regulatory-like domain
MNARAREAVLLVLILLGLTGPSIAAQELGGAGTVQGTITDPTGGVMQAVEVKLSNPVSGLARTTTTDAAGKFVFRNLPPNPYHVTVEAQGFKSIERDVAVRSGVPIDLDLKLEVGVTEAVSVVGHAEDLLERDPTAHTDIDTSRIEKMPIETAAGLNQVITLASPGVVADSNGFFHPIGDHAQTQFSIDNQPVTDQQSRIYSNQISPDAVQSMEVITGVAPAEYGDKSSLVVHIVTKSGLDSKPSGSASFDYGSFKSPSGEFNFGVGGHAVGNFVSASGLRTERYLDAPEFEALHDTGNHQSLFDRVDLHPSDADTIHLNVQYGRSSFDVPNTYDQIAQTQHQNIETYNIAPGYSRVIGSKTLFTANGFVRHDHITYLPSADPFADTPATVSQDRTLANYGAKFDVSYSSGAHNIKVGGTVSATRLDESFTLGITDPADATWQDENGNFDPKFAPYDLTSGGRPFVFNGAGTIKQQAAYAQDDIKAGDATIKVGLRLDRYDGLTSKTELQPRLGISYAVPGSSTVLRASYGRTMETPYNENLLLSSGFGGAAALVGSGNPPPPGIRNQGEIGIQQGIGKWVVADFGYFNKHTQNGYDFNVLFNTPIVFPVAWDHSRINGFTGRVDLVQHAGFSAFVVMAHTSAIFSPPGVGGVLLEEPAGDFRIDHDQAFNSTTNLQYVFEKKTGAWAALSWRYDSGLVAGSVGSLEDALGLTADQQTAIGFYCGSAVASLGNPLTSAQCTPGNYGATRLVIPAEGTEDDVNNPPRIAPRHLFDLGLGVDNVLGASSGVKIKVRVSVINLTNKEALYNFLSTFTGTHFVTPRAYQFSVGVNF